MDVLLSILLLIFLLWFIGLRIVARIHTFPIPARTCMLLEIPTRELVVGKKKLLERSGVRDGMKVLEVGCGTGYYTLEAAAMVGDGILCALELQERALKRLMKKVEGREIANLFPLVGDAQRLPFRDEVFDLAFLVAVLGEIPDKDKAIKDLKRSLKSEATLSITEFLPDPHYTMRSSIERLAKGHGLQMAEYVGNFFCYTINLHHQTSS